MVSQEVFFVSDRKGVGGSCCCWNNSNFLLCWGSVRRLAVCDDSWINQMNVSGVSGTRHIFEMCMLPLLMAISFTSIVYATEKGLTKSMVANHVILLLSYSIATRCLLPTSDETPAAIGSPLRLLEPCPKVPQGRFTKRERKSDLPLGTRVERFVALYLLLSCSLCMLYRVFFFVLERIDVRVSLGV